MTIACGAVESAAAPGIVMRVGCEAILERIMTGPAPELLAGASETTSPFGSVIGAAPGRRVVAIEPEGVNIRALRPGVRDTG